MWIERLLKERSRSAGLAIFGRNVSDLLITGRDACSSQSGLPQARAAHHYEVPANSHHYAGNMLWRTVTVLSLADRQLQPYASSVTIAASIDRAGVRPLSLCTQNRIMNPVAAHKDELKKLLENLSGDTDVSGITFVASLD